jgi:predicted transcriptional regulator
MKTVTIEVAARAAVDARIKAAFRGRKQGAFITFPTVEAMQRMLTLNRWQILRAMMGAPPSGVRELARRLARDVKSVHSDLQALVGGGLIDRADDGKYYFPFDAVRVDFTVKAA